MKSLLLAPALVAAAVVTTGCGDLKLGDKVQLLLNPETQKAQLTVEMSDGLQINMLNGEFPIADGKGKLIFVPATRTENARIGVEVDLVALAAGQLGNIGTTTTLPNGSPMPVAITPPLLTVPVFRNASFDAKAMLSLTPELQIGAAISIAQMNSRYIPNGISVCQNFRNEQNLAFAAICLYGPGEGSNGGVFIGANLGDVLNLDQQPARELRSSSALMASSSPLTSTLKAFAPINLSSEDWSYQMHDPKKDLSGSKGFKVLRNVQKVLKSK